MTQDETIELACQTFGGIIKKGERKNFLAFAKLIAEKAIKETLAQPEQDPVAIRYDYDGYGYQYIDSGSGSDWQKRVQGEPLYTAPQIKIGCAECGVNGNHALYCVKCAEKYLKEKNT